ncbi:outer membrane beta-barrel protein [Roseibacillus persicicus]|uniref:Outer membrane protein beta-barrel domain-containing protein n=1 Tax=Roseibacillus persicicus TaxID=454148 RepID=A0A918TGJ1_9BACT|nr:outer membrane beta-barrel protein [Roseibacillus persicicus]GHC45148.1 hypothetical protein GCM10007100_08000 [Roseibacillus persicicus]
MNFLKKSIFAGVLPCAVASGQGLYSIAPNDDEASSSLPLTYIVGASLGYDDNPTPLTDSDEGSLYASGFVQANWTSVTPQTTWDVFARLGVRYYFDDFESSDADSTNFDARVGVNFTHRFSERLRFSSRNLLAYEQEPDYDYGLSNDRRTGDYFRYSSDNSVGYRWSDRLGTQTGIQFSGVQYQDLDNSDYSQVAFRHDFRYRMSPATVVTAGYKYAIVDLDSGNDSTSHYLTGGIEHRISPESAIVLRAGAQITDPDNGDSRTRPFLEAALKSSLTSQLSTNLFVRYSNESWNQSLLSDNGRQTFEQSQTFRLGGKATYALNPQVSLFGGVNYILTNYDDQIIGADGDGSESLLNLNVGGSYQLSSNLYLTGSYNFTTSISDFDGRDYDRNRFQLGVQATF